jgi:glycosyltransferase involved in cell wall biosynthesis
VKLLFFGDLAATGFGTVTSDLGRALLERGVDVRFVSQNDAGGLDEPFVSRTLDVLSLVHHGATAAEPHGGLDGVPAFIPNLLTGNAADMTKTDDEPWGDWKPDAALVLGDFYGVRLMAIPYLQAFKSIPSYHYCPVEGHDLPPEWNGIWNIIRPIAMSKFGQHEIARVTRQMPPLMYHGVDSEQFRPITANEPMTFTSGDKTITLTSKERCKAFFGIHPKARVVLRTDRFMPRKGYPALLRAMTKVMAEREDVVLMLHCRTFDQGGFMADLLSKMPRDIAARVSAPSLGAMPRDVLTALYNAADVYASTSAEGFGLTIAEALACGVPAVGLDYSAVPEVIGDGGMKVSVGKHIDNEYGHHWALPDEDEFARSVGYLLDHPARAREMGVTGRRHVQRTFTWDAAADVMAGLLEPQRELVAV